MNRETPVEFGCGRLRNERFCNSSAKGEGEPLAGEEINIQNNFVENLRIIIEETKDSVNPGNHCIAMDSDMFD